ncbi:carboxyl-terminal proteinase [Ophiocordyceps sinensis CO18]|uniref:Carboxyl-terminal proteinase n=1 Tax=Ophiocordyceps sinensis (strain Co18 / CGMCC 3.14243) TaxID=911162 RepID=T5AN66_OPHSC|nr:carboxyl-terminal proteinase [Ophiocordyceps sinensis CO18]
MRWLFIKTLPAMLLLHSASAGLAHGRGGRLKVVKTTTNANGQVIDWIVPESQDRIATRPPPPPKGKNSAQPMNTEKLIPAMDGPKGTVPILRSRGPTLPIKRLPEPEDDGAGANQTRAMASSYAGRHWYASSSQGVANRGGRAAFSLFKAYVQSGSDFSLLQTAVIRGSAAHAGTGPVMQTVEAGWINYPNQAQPPHLFSYFTTNGHGPVGDGLGGWNREHAGWGQGDEIIYPGVPIAPVAVDGGTQSEAEMGFVLFEGNWWLWVLGRWAGYYPGSLFSRDVEARDTLEGGANRINFYGEIYNSGPQMTTTDMGSGEFPESGFGHAAYLHNMVYLDADDGRVSHDFDGSAEIIVSDRDRYRIQPSFKSGGSWGSYLYVGGPGAGGVVGR